MPYIGPSCHEVSIQDRDGADSGQSGPRPSANRLVRIGGQAVVRPGKAPRQSTQLFLCFRGDPMGSRSSRVAAAVDRHSRRARSTLVPTAAGAASRAPVIPGSQEVAGSIPASSTNPNLVYGSLASAPPPIAPLLHATAA